MGNIRFSSYLPLIELMKRSKPCTIQMNLRGLLGQFTYPTLSV